MIFGWSSVISGEGLTLIQNTCLSNKSKSRPVMHTTTLNIFVKFIELLYPECEQIKIFRNVMNPLATDRVTSRKNGIFKNEFGKNNVINFQVNISLFISYYFQTYVRVII
jgi:hypothetical protein